jgi:hypothetical protein
MVRAAGGRTGTALSSRVIFLPAMALAAGPRRVRALGAARLAGIQASPNAGEG